VYARTGVVLVLISGVIAALVYAGSVNMLLAATWGRLLLIKLAGMLGVLILGWYNWRVVTPALDGADPGARRRLRVAIRLELLLALAMLAITTMLVVSPLPGEG
jgi:putative copper export protein